MSGRGVFGVTESGLSTRTFLLDRRFVFVVTILFSIYMYGWTTKWSFDPTPSFRHSQDFFFTAQADSLLRGRLWVDPASIGPGTVDECFFVGGKCYGYFGIAPSLLRIPILLIFGSTTVGFAPLMIPLAAAIAFASALDLCRRQVRQRLTGLTASTFMLIAAVVLGPGSVLVLLADPYVYQEAILWGIAGVLLGINLFSQWLRSGRTSHLLGSVLACAFAAGSRPSAVLVGPTLALLLALKFRRRLLKNGVGLFAAVMFLVLPIILSVGVVFAKFGQVGLPENAYRNPTGEVREPSMGACKFNFDPNVKVVPTNLFAYLRPDAVRIRTGEWPPIRFRFNGCVGANKPTYLWPLKNGPVGELYVEKTTSLSATMPLPVIATAASIVFLVRKRRRTQLMILAGVGTMGLSVAATMAMTSRYLGDFYALVAIGLAYSVEPLSQMKGFSKRTAAFAIASLLGLWSLAANPSLFYLHARLFW